MHTFGSSGTPAFGAQPSFAFGSTPATTPAAASGPSTGFSFGSPTAAPAPSVSTGFSFAAPSTPPATPSGGLFGNPAPAQQLPPVGGGLFGTPAPSTGLFGVPSSSVPGQGGLFGSLGSPAPAPGMVFGSAPSTLFGAPAPTVSLFGALQPWQQQQQQMAQLQQTQIPAQAALQAHMDASARQEQFRVESALSQIHQQYIGTQPASDKSSHFVSILYNQATSEYQQLQWLHGTWVVPSSSSSLDPGHQAMRRPVAPPRPPQVSERDWEKAVVRNPDHTHCMPAALVGAEALQGRLGSQQERANSIVDQLKDLEECREVIAERYERVQMQMEAVQQRHMRQRHKLLDVMKRVEIFRCYNIPLQGDEIKAMHKVANIHEEVSRLTSNMQALRVSAKEKIKSSSTTSAWETREIPNEGELKVKLSEHREELATLVLQVKQDLRNLHLIQQRIETVNAPRIAVPYGYRKDQRH